MNSVVIGILTAVVLTTGAGYNQTENVSLPVETQQVETVEYVEELPQEPVDVMVAQNLPSQTKGEFKTYMSYKAITSKSSPQYKLQKTAWTDNKGFRRIGDDYCIALGSAYGTKIGTRYRIVLESGIEFIGILSDCKANKHTDSTNRYIPKNGNIVEFLTDTSKMERISKKMGDVSHSGFKGGVVSLEKIIS